MRVDVLRLGRGARAALCVAALAPAALGVGCARFGPATPEGGAAARTPEALLAQTATPTPAPEAAVVESPLPPPDGFVADFAEVIDDKTEGVLEAKLKQLKERVNIELAVATVETTGGRDVFEYSLAVARGWGLGPPAGEEGGGLLLLLAVKDRKWQIQVTRSLKDDITDGAAAEIGNGMTDALRMERYGEAVTKCVDDLIERLAARRGFPAKAVNGKQ